MQRDHLRWKQHCDLLAILSTALKSISHVSYSSFCVIWSDFATLLLSVIAVSAMMQFKVLHDFCFKFLIIVLKVGWDASVESLRAACCILDCPEGIPFLDEYLLRMITILVSQRLVILLRVHFVLDVFQSHRHANFLLYLIYNNSNASRNEQSL